ncbi:hypothetical protein SUGI_0359010 [Cryptomeria japonica]|nr:hypothetical protein SUGI_0359010 [Cryptomeria japonica]
MIKFLPKGFFVVIFPKEEDRDHFISLQNWFLDDHPLYIQPWSLNFDPTSLVLYDKPVRIQLYNLLIEYWSEACLEMIGRSLGTLLEIDEDIGEGDLYTYARLKIAVVKTIPSSIMLLTTDEGPKSINIGANQDVSTEIPTQDIPLDSNIIPNNDTMMNPMEYPIVEEVLQECDSDTSESVTDGDVLNIVDPRYISQSTNIVLGRVKGTRGRKSHKTIREQRANEKGSVSMLKFLNPTKRGKPSLGGR